MNVFYPALKHVADYLREVGLPAWSFNQGIGQDIFPFSLSDPFNYPLYLAGSERLVDWIPWVECAKLLLGGLFFQKYLRLMSVGGYVSVFGGLLFSFSGYAIIGSTWYVFSGNLVHISFLLLAFELFYQKKVWWPFPLAVGLVAAYSPFSAYLYLGFLAVYYFWRFFSPAFFEKKETGSTPDWLGFSKTSCQLIALALLGFAITVVVWMPALLEMLNSPRMGVANKAGSLRDFSIFGIEKSLHNGTAASIFPTTSLALPASSLDGAITSNHR